MTITTHGQSELEDALGNLVPSCSTYSAVTVSGEHLQRLPNDLIPAAAVPKRQREFAAGRVAASNALSRAGITDYFPAIGEMRQPIWPDGFVGSISHDNDIAIAVVAPASELIGLGLDVESVHLPDSSIRSQIMSTLEGALWAEHCGGDKDAAAMMVFSYKEAIFKCAYPVTGVFLEFLDVVVKPGCASPIARCCRLVHPANSIVEDIVGDISLCGERVLTACWIENS